MALLALQQLYTTLLDKPEPEKITTEENNFLLSCNRKIVRTSLYASGIGGGLAWSASRKLTKLGGLGRFGLAAGTATAMLFTGIEWAGARTAIPCLDHILGQDATRMQKELVNILVTYNQGEPWRWKLMSKHFYPESVYNDEVDKPQMRWRRRNTSTDSALSSHDTNKAKPQISHNNSPSSPDRSIPRGSDVSRTKPKLQNSTVNSDGEILEDPLGGLFGGPETTVDDVNAPAKPNGSSKVQTRKQRRAYRRQRLKNREASPRSPLYERT